MRDDFRKLRSLPARPTSDLFEVLKSAGAAELKGTAEDAPRVTLHLASGRDIYGTVVGMADNRYGTSTVLMQTGGDRRYELGGDATYIAMASVEAVTVHDATVWADLLAGGKLAAVDPPPTKLGAKRAIEHDRERASKAAGKELTWSAQLENVDGEVLRILVAMSNQLASIVEGLAKDDLGRAALAGLRGATLEHNDTLNVRSDNGVMHVRGSEQSLDTLRKAVEAAL
jgi:hypothetical protein